MSQNKCWYHPTRKAITTCEHCRKPLCIDCWWHFSKKAVIICEHCKRPLCLECSHHPCPISKDLELQEDCKKNNLLLGYVSKIKRLFRKNKNVFHPLRTGYYLCKYCNGEKKKFFTCKYCNERMCKDCIKHLCPQRENLARHIKFRDIDFRYVFLSVLLFLWGLGGFSILVQLFDQVCNDIDESCVYLCADIYASCCFMGLAIALAIKEIKSSLKSSSVL